MIRAAGIDCGTNSVRLLIVEAPEPDAVPDGPAEPGPGPVREVTRLLRIPRLGEGVDATGEFSPAALARTFTVIEEYASLIRAAGVPADRIRMVATSAARDVGHRSVFVAGVRDRLGVPPTVVSGRREADLSFHGALAGLAALGRTVAGPVLVTDVGGGSSELVLGDTDGTVRQAVSLDLGCVRLRERILRGDPPTPDQIEEARQTVDDALGGCGVDLASARTWIGVAGTVTSLVAAHKDLPAYDRETLHGATTGVAELEAEAERFVTASVARLRTIPSLHPKRAEVIGAGALVLDRIARRLTVAELMVSESDILDGVAAWALRGDAGPLPSE